MTMSSTNDPLAVLTFTIANQHYALDISSVVEVAAMVELVKVHNARPEVLGVVNRHGSALPMIDMSQVFGEDATSITDFSLFIVVEVLEMSAGLVVDSVEQVEYIPAPHLKATSTAGNYIRGIISYRDILIQLIDIDKLLPVLIDGAVLNEELLKVDD